MVQSRKGIFPKWDYGSVKMVKSRGFDVYLNGKLIDTVWFDVDMSIEEMKKSLVEHDGYNPNIEVKE